MAAAWESRHEEATVSLGAWACMNLWSHAGSTCAPPTQQYEQSSFRSGCHSSMLVMQILGRKNARKYSMKLALGGKA